MQQQQYQHSSQGSLSQPVFLILLSLVHGPKQTVELRESIEERTGLFIEPGTLYRVLARLERCGWIEGLDESGPLRRYRLTALGMLALEQAEAGNHKEMPREGRRPEVRKGKELIMRLVLWILCLYPPAWRERYEMEMEALLAQHHITLWTVLDLLMGALDARLDPHYRRARQLLPLRHFQTSWRLVVCALVAFWIALLPWLWMSVLGISPDAECSNWGNSYVLCMMRVAVGMHGFPMAQMLVQMILVLLPILLIVFTIILVLARGSKARTHLLLALPVTLGMIVLCISCGVWLSTLWPLLPQISHFYPQAPAALLVGLIGMGLATVLAVGSLVRAAFALKALSAASPKQESRPFFSYQQEGEPAQDTGTAQFSPSPASAARGRANSVPKGWIVLLVVLLLLFILPWPILVTPDDPPLWMLLGSWFLAAGMGIVIALLVTIRSRWPRFWRTLKVWGSVVPVVLYLLLSMLGGLLHFPLLNVGYWLLASWVSLILIPALFGWDGRGHPQADRETEPPGKGYCWRTKIPSLTRLVRFASPGGPINRASTDLNALRQQYRKGLSPGMRVVVVLLIWFAFTLPWLLALVFGHPPVFGVITGLIIFSCIYITLALIVKVYNRHERAARAAQKPRNAVSPKVWILVLPVLFLVFCMQIEFIVLPDYNDFGQVLISWLLTGLASLIILLTLKLGSRESRALPTQEALQPVQGQG